MVDEEELDDVEDLEELLLVEEELEELELLLADELFEDVEDDEAVEVDEDLGVVVMVTFVVKTSVNNDVEPLSTLVSVWVTRESLTVVSLLSRLATTGGVGEIC